MPENSLDVEVEIDAALRELREDRDALEDGAERALNQLTVLAEGAMKAEAPEGAGVSTHLRDTIRTTDKRGLKKEVMPHKRTSDGWLLHRAIVGNPATPRYGGAKPPVWPGSGGDAQGPLAEWARAKLGDRNAAWAIRESIFQSGQASFPNKFIGRSRREWEGQVERIAGRAIENALGSGGA